jgi:hypothetical protein
LRQINLNYFIIFYKVWYGVEWLISRSDSVNASNFGLVKNENNEKNSKAIKQENVVLQETNNNHEKINHNKKEE